MRVEVGMEVEYLGQRVKVLGVRRIAGGQAADIFYMSGSHVGMEVTVNADNLEPLGAYARPTFQPPAAPGARA